jgi:hypothetical protein
MKHRLSLTLLTVGLTGAALSAAYAVNSPADQLFTDTPSQYSGFVGYHLMSLTSDPQYLPFGISFDLGTLAGGYTPNYMLGMERGNNDFFVGSYPPNPAGAVWGQFRLRGDTGQIETGPQISHPATSNQFNIAAGHDANPVFGLDGLGVSVNGIQSNINLTQRGYGTSTKRTSVTFGTPATGYQIGTDSAASGTNDWYLKDLSSGLFPLKVSPSSDLVTIGSGATINGTTTVNGPTSLLGSTTTIGNNNNSLLGFYGHAPAPLPVVSGCICDGTALKSLIQALASQGLCVDNTTP